MGSGRAPPAHDPPDREYPDFAPARRPSEHTAKRNAVRAVCRDWVLYSGADVFDTAPGEVAVGVVADSLRRSRIQVDVGVLAPDEPGRQCRVLSQETTEVQGHEFPCYLEWVHRSASCLP